MPIDTLTLRPGTYKEVPGTSYGTPKEVWGFRSPRVPGPALAVARAFIADNARLLGTAGVTLREPPRIVESLGAQHVIFQQVHRGQRVHRAYLTVHVARDGRVYLVKNRVVPKGLLPAAPKAAITPERAVQLARRALPGRAREARVLGVPERLWFPARTLLHPTFRVRIHRRTARRRGEWIVYVDRETGAIRSRYDNLAEARGWARVFDPNPVCALGDGAELLRDGKRVLHPPARAYTKVPLDALKGNGRLDGRRVSTRPTPDRVRRADLRFLYDSTHDGFDEAMVYYHVDRAIHYVESLGYRGRRAVFRKPLPVNVHGTKDDNSWYSPGLRRLTFGTGGVDDAEDGDTILHDFGHALQDAICPDFGQSAEAAAMGEGFGDYFAASFFADRKPEAYRPTIAAWDGITTETAAPPPCVRRVDGRRTYESFDHRPSADEHDNGTIWSATLWDVRAAVGQDVADRVILESHFQLDGFTTFARGARAILDADRNLFRGRHQAALRQVFRERGIGPVE
jgi:hypothetical protein